MALRKLRRKIMYLLYKIIFLLFLCTSNAESEDPLGEFCNTNTNISSGGKLSANIDKLLAELVLKGPLALISATNLQPSELKLGCYQNYAMENISIALEYGGCICQEEFVKEKNK